MYLLDTNVCIDFALARSERLRVRLRAGFTQGLAISTVTLAELRVGARHPDATAKDDRLLDMLIGLLQVHPFDEAAAETYGRLAREIGVKRRSFDRLIAAHAVSLNLTLITNNTKDFEGVSGLKVENWTL